MLQSEGLKSIQSTNAALCRAADECQLEQLIVFICKTASKNDLSTTAAGFNVLIKPYITQKFPTLKISKICIP